MRFAAAALLVFASQTPAVTIDQIAITVDHEVITESQIDADIRITAFLNRQSVVISPEQRRASAARLIDQLLIGKEIALTNYPQPAESEIDAALARLRSTYAGNDAWQRGLDSSQLEESDIRRHLALQIATLSFVGFRFRPESRITDSDIADYYRHEIEAQKTGHPGEPVPSLDASRDSIRRSLIEERTDEALDDWLARARRRARIAYLDKSLEPSPVNQP